MEVERHAEHADANQQNQVKLGIIRYQSLCHTRCTQPGCDDRPARSCGRKSQFGFWTLAILISLGAFSTACRTTATRQISDLGPAIARLQAGSSLQAEVDSLAQPLLASGEAYGLVVGVVLPDGTTQTFGYGHSGRAGDRNPPDANSVFQIGSVSKVFVAALLARLVEEGQVRYEDTVREILPTNIVVSAEVGQLTLYDLITHTSGLTREPMSPRQLWSLVRYMVLGRNLYAHITSAYAYQYLHDCHPRRQEPRHFFYSNFGFGLLAHLITVKTGRPVTELIEEKICRPLNMTNSVFCLNASQQQRLAMGHVGNQACWKFPDAPMPPWNMGDLMSPVGGMYSTANDLLTFAKANLATTPHPLAATLAAIRSVQIESARGGEALGWIVNRFDNGQQIITFKDGMVSGYRAYIGMDLNARVGVVVLQNQFNWDDKIAHNLLVRLSSFYGSHQPNPTARY